MAPGVSTSSSVSGRDTLRARVVYWFLLHGDRRAVTGSIILGVVAIFGVLITTGILAVGPGGSASTVFGSGLTSGIVTLVTIALSINQLILTRVFGSPNELTNRLEGTRDLRQNIEALADEPSTPNDPADFLSLLATTLHDRALDLLAELEASEWEPPPEVTSAVRDIADYGDTIDDRLAGQAQIVGVLEIVLGTEYALNMTAVHHLQNEYDEFLSEGVREDFQAVGTLLESIAVTRQFFKTITLQQDFARLSRLIVYLGLVGLVVTISLTLIYRGNSVTVPTSLLPVIVSLGIGAIISPLAVFVAYIIRAATIAHRTVSVGPFIPPKGS